LMLQPDLTGRIIDDQPRSAPLLRRYRARSLAASLRRATPLGIWPGLKFVSPNAAEWKLGDDSTLSLAELLMLSKT
jgi:hypothetical protein